MYVYDMIENMLASRPDARGVILSSTLWAQHLEEQVGDMISQGHDMRGVRFFVADKPVLHCPSLKSGTAEFVTWPEAYGPLNFRGPDGPVGAKEYEPGRQRRW